MRDDNSNDDICDNDDNKGDEGTSDATSALLYSILLRCVMIVLYLGFWILHFYVKLQSHYIILTTPHPTPPLPTQMIQLNFKLLFFIYTSFFLFFLSFYLSFFEGDRFRVEHVIINFLSNAVKFSPDGSEIIIQISGRNPHSEARNEPRKIPEGLSHRGTKGAGKEKEKDKEKDMRTLWSRSSSFANQDCKYCTVPYRTATCNTSQFSFPLAYLYFVMICSMCCSN